MTSLQKRLIFSSLFIGIALFAVFYSPEWVFFAVVEAFILLGLNEFFVLAERKGFVVNRVLGLFFGGLLPFSFYFSSESMILVFASLSVFVFNFHRKFREQALVSTSVTIFGIIYVSWFFSFLNKLHAMEHGPLWVFYTLLLIKGGDAGAYFVGGALGKTKLAVHISPNKSVEGAVGGFVTTLLLSFLSKLFLPFVGWHHLLILGMIVGVLSQLGDLIESLIKRDVGVKDSGHIPGLGGILDVLDSLLLATPVVYYYVVAFPTLF